MKIAVSARLLVVFLGAAQVAAAQGVWRQVVAPAATRWFVKSAAVVDRETVVAATWPADEAASAEHPSVWTVNLRTGKRRCVLRDLTAWDVVAADAGGFWLLPRFGNEIRRYTLAGRLAERRRLPIRAQGLKRAGGELLIVQMAFGGRGKLLWRGKGGRFVPWADEIQPGAGDLASLIRRNTVLVAASENRAAVARPFVGPGLVILDRDGNPVVRTELPPMKPQAGRGPHRVRGEEPVFPLVDLAVDAKYVYCLVGKGDRESGARGGEQRLVVMRLSGEVERSVATPVKAACVLLDSGGEPLILDHRLGIYRLSDREGKAR